MPGAIWLALMPYVASNCGVATYTVPVKFCTPCSGRPAWYRLLVDSSGTAGACRLAARVFTRVVRAASWAALSCVICPGPSSARARRYSLAAGQVGADPVERIVELDAGDDADPHGQEHGERGRRQRGTGPGPVADQVAQRDPDRDRQPRARPGRQHADGQRGEQDDADDGGDQAGQQEQRVPVAALPPATRLRPPANARHADAGREHDDAGQGGAVHRLGRRGAAGQRGHHRHARPSSWPGGGRPAPTSRSRARSRCANAHHGRFAASTTWPVACCSVGT